MKILESLPAGESAGESIAARLLRWVLLLAAVLLLASMADVSRLVPYHARVRGIYLTLVPLTVGYALGAACGRWARRNIPLLLIGTAAVLLLAIIPTLRHDLPRRFTFVTLAAGVCVAVVLVRLGLLQAGIGWHGRKDEEHLPRWMGAAAMAIAWTWLASAAINPRESFPPTRWLLTVTGNRPAPTALLPAEVHAQDFDFRGGILASPGWAGKTPVAAAGPYRFYITALRPAAGRLRVGVSAARISSPKGLSPRPPVWLTLDADDPAHPDTFNDTDLFDVSRLPADDPNARAIRACIAALETPEENMALQGYATFTLSQSLPAVHLRARLWSLQRGAPDGTLYFQPLVEADLGTWDLTPLRYLRPQPVR